MNEGTLSTLITPSALAFSLAMCLMLVALPRRYALVPVVALTCYMTVAVRVIVVGMDFTMIRVLVLAGWVRILFRGEIKTLRLCRMDRLVLAWVAVGSSAYILLRHDGHAVVNQLGCAYNTLGMYFLFRVLVRDIADVQRMFKVCALLLAPMAVLMVLEHITYRSLLMSLYGLPDGVYVREGEVRALGAFGHPILAGVFAATMVPWFVATWRVRGAKLASAVGLVSALAVTVVTASSTPILAALAGYGSMFLWRIREQMRVLRWGLVVVVLVLQIVMNAPVWFIIARVAVIGSSTAWHRAYLIDRALANISDWWLLGTLNTGAWGARLTDVTNQFLTVAADGGLAAMLLFMLVLAEAFRLVGRSWRLIPPDQLNQRLCVWALGASLLAHITAFVGVSYWDQTIVALHLLLAAIASVGVSLMARVQSRNHVARTDSFDAKEMSPETVPETALQLHAFRF